jgi:hypothetical protein
MLCGSDEILKINYLSHEFRLLKTRLGWKARQRAM